MDYNKESLKKHYEWQGKIEIACRAPLVTREDLSLAYTPGVAAPCLAIRDDLSKSFELTRRGNIVAVITDGTAVLGLGDIGPEAAMPVMEGKCALFREFAGIDAIPLCLRSKEVEEIVHTVQLLAGSFGGVNLEDIAAPRCFEIERRLRETCDIPVFHDDQHGTAIVVLAAVINALRVTGREAEKSSAVINGAGAAGTAIARLLLSLGLGDIILCDRSGAIYEGAPELTEAQAELSKVTNRENRRGTLGEILCGADIFIGVSAPGCVSAEMIAAMAPDPVIFALANPVPEILPDEAKRGGAAVVGTGRSDFPNQINNVLAFPGIFRGALDVRARDITNEMKLAAARAIAEYIPADELNPENIIPCALDKGVAAAVGAAVGAAYRA